ncbi:MAG: hypothetical protein AB9869_23560 [Verrucomicrobiia bacterium]
MPQASMTCGVAFKNVKFPNAEALGNRINLAQLNIFEDSTFGNDRAAA